MKKTNHPLRLLWLCLALPLLSFGQTSNSQYYKWFDSLISIQNAGLYSGVEYIDIDRATPEAHKFFETPKFVKGDISHDGQMYYNIDLKYNVFDDMLIVKLPNQASEATLVPIKSQVNGFTTGAHTFVNIQNTEASNQRIEGFYEVLQKTEYFTLYKRYNKSRSTKLDSDRSYFEYKDAKPDYYLLYNNQYERVNSKKDLAKIFPQFKKEINSFRDNRNKNELNMNDTYFKNVLQRVHSLLANSNNAN